MPHDMKVANCVDRVEEINEWLSLLHREAERLSERETIRKVISPKQHPKRMGKGLHFKRRWQGQDFETSQDDLENDQESAWQWQDWARFIRQEEAQGPCAQSDWHQQVPLGRTQSPLEKRSEQSCLEVFQWNSLFQDPGTGTRWYARAK